MIRHASATAATAIACLLLAACASSPIDSGDRQAILDQVHPGMSFLEAEADIEGMGYDCVTRPGGYDDETGAGENPRHRFIDCTKRPGVISFQCNMRVHAIVEAEGRKVSKVRVIEAPSCQHSVESPPSHD
jgi:hypothetical protein